MCVPRRRAVLNLPKAREHSGSSRLIVLLAVTAGLSIASNYYIQPLAPNVAADLGAPREQSGLLVTLSQVGYLAGLLAFVPLGDLVDRRRLICRLVTATGLGLLLASLANTPVWIAICLFGFGATTVVTQVSITFAADVAASQRRGRDVATVATGGVLGVLLGRTLAGVSAELVGWRGVYACAGGSLLVLAWLLRCWLPALAPTRADGYRAALRGTVTALADHARLRRACLYSGLTFAAFSAVWATLATMLSAPPHHLSEGAIGLFGLAAAGGALGASAGGRLFDKGHGAVVARAALGLGIAALSLLAFGRTSLALILIGVLAIDLAGQLIQIINQASIYSLDDARSRLTAPFMASRFVGGAVGSALGTVAFAAEGWTASCLIGVGFYVLAVGLSVASRPRTAASA
jgi:predicted MFS family arabinose efflux permease